MQNINDDSTLTVTSFFSNWWKRQKLSMKLHSLDNRMLSDIGVNRSEIDHVAEHSFPRVSFIELSAILLEKWAAALKNREAAWELADYDNRQLTDIGISRSDIRAIASGHYPKRHRDASPLTAYGINIQANNDDHRHVA